MPTILLKKSDTPGSVPGTANLTNLAGGAEVAVNTADKRMFSMTSASAVIELGTNPSSLTCADASFTVARVGSLTISSLSLSNATITSATITNLTATSLTLSNNPTFSGGTANGVLYLNGSKVATSGSALNFNGTALGVGTASDPASSSAIFYTRNDTGAAASFNSIGTNGARIVFGNIGNDTFGIGMPASTGSLAFYSSNTTELMRLTSTGLGIGTASPSAKLSISGGNIFVDNANGSLIIRNADVTNQQQIRLRMASNDGVLDVTRAGGTAPNLIFGTEGTEKMRLDSSGNLGLGVTPSAWTYRSLSVGSTGSAIWQTGTDFGLSQNAYYDSGWKYAANGVAALYDLAGSAHVWYQAVSGTINTAITFTQAMTLDASGNLLVGTTTTLGRITTSGGGDQSIWFTHNDNTPGRTVTLRLGNNDSTYKNYSPYVQAIQGSGIDNYSLAFGTSTSTSGGAVERARITNGGYSKFSNDGTYLGSTSDYHEFRSNITVANGVLFVHATSASATSDGIIQSRASRNTTNNTFYAFSYYNDAAAAYKFRVADSGDCTNTNGTYGQISDQKHKTDIVDAGSQWADLKAVRFRKFKMKDDPTGLVQLGVVAQELEQVSPGLVAEHADRDAEGNDLGTTTKSVKTSVLLMKAAVALQEAMARIEQLEADVAAMKGAA